MKKLHKEHKIVLCKISFTFITLCFLLINFPLLDWFLHSERMWYDEFELNPDTSFLFHIYEKQGILDETIGFIYSMTYSSKWMHICYHLYNMVPCIELDPFFLGFLVFLIPMIKLSTYDINAHKNHNIRKTTLFYAIQYIVVIIIRIYGVFVYAPQYYSTILDIVQCI